MLKVAFAVFNPENGRLSIQRAIVLPMMNRRLPPPFLTEALEHSDALVWTVIVAWTGLVPDTVASEIE